MENLLETLKIMNIFYNCLINKLWKHGRSDRR